MAKLTMMIRAICWMLWMMLYTGIAGWVGEGLWHDNGVRLIAAMGALGWAVFGFGVIEIDEYPKRLANQLLEDD